MNIEEARKLVVEILGEKTQLMDSPTISPKLRDASADVPMAELELDSLEQVDISMEIEIRTGLHFDLAELAEAQSLNSLAAHIARRFER